MNETDARWLRAAFEVACRAGARGDQPFGAVLVDAVGELLMEAGNTIASERDCTGHAEINLVRAACHQLEPAVLAGCTLYASTEPCAMCAGAIFWSGIRRVVFGLSSARFHAWLGHIPDQPALGVSGHDLLARSHPPTEVVGPVLEAEALAVHEGFWPRPT